MSHKLALFWLLALSIFFNHTASSQSQDAVFLNGFSFDKKEQLVKLSIKTNESFIVGANRYVLHISGKYFLRNLHPEGRLDEIVFYIPLTDYNNLTADGDIVLVYGLYYDNIQQDNESNQISGYNGKHWKLGKFQPQNFKQ